MWIFNIFIEPLKMVFELIFSLAHKVAPMPVVDIAILSIAVNFLALPLYLRADKVQKAARDKEDEIRSMADHIRKHFKGDEKVMMLQVYYEQKHYHPLSSLRSIISLLLQIPFFIAAYQFLSNLAILEGQKAGPIDDLIKPDGLITIGALSINLLPILMTVINIISSEIYTKGQPFKSKIILYVTAAVFLVLLYDSPSGLVLYWTLNNVFSLVKNIIQMRLEKRHTGEKKVKACGAYDHVLFYVSAIYVTILLACVIPSAVIGASPLEFINRMIFDDPMQYVVQAMLTGTGLFLFWPMVYYWLMTDRWKRVFGLVAASSAVCATVTYLFFGPVGRRLTSVLAIDGTYSAGITDVIINSLVIAAVTALVCFAGIRFGKVLRYVIITGIIAVSVMAGINIAKINSKVSAYVANRDGSEQTGDSVPQDGVIELSSDGRNVVVIMLDRALGGMIPYLMEEKPDLVRQFDGFTYYPNTVSYGDHTTVGAPSIFGGYDYTPGRILKDTDLTLTEKNSESLLVLPVLFAQNGYHSIVIDPPDVNYNPIPDMTVYDQLEGVDGYLIANAADAEYAETYGAVKTMRYRNITYYALLRTVPVVLHGIIYDNGNYNYLQGINDSNKVVMYQTPVSMSRATGLNPEFMTAFGMIDSLPSLTKVSEGKGNLILIANNTTHEQAILQEPSYLPSADIDNTVYDVANSGRFELNGRRMKIDDFDSMSHYHINMAAMITLGKWFDSLREMGVWDNTRIVIVADHGKAVGHFEELQNDELGVDFEAYNPLLMVKDFDSTGFATEEELRTNADVPAFAVEGLIDDARNPFTGNPIVSIDSLGEPVRVVKYSLESGQEDGDSSLVAKWYEIRGSIWDSDNWSYVGEY
ncbi:membrane protein insertase, YidC/Oxa1 family, C-terminal domain-containing protein [Ruminococcaceae bacterium YRB3002]|nr:membrane protein insertase, YidC/Oxa1 family, C-terminal domain-containing protein [Ruminococcaceae bacterium YRB3002]